MSEKYSVSPQELISLSGSIASSVSSAESSAASIDSYVDKISEGWQGEASNNFRDNLRGYHTKLTKALNALEAEEKVLNDLADSFYSDDEEIIRTFD